MEHGNADATTVLTQTLVFLAATCLIIPALKRLRISAVMGFLLIGVAMGPHVLGRMAENWPWLTPFELEESEPTRVLAEFGVIFLLFVIGLEVSWERLWALRRYVLGLGLAQVAVTAAVVMAIAISLGTPIGASAVLGLAFALSSTALVMQLLRERNQSATPVGRVSLSVLLMQDLLIVPILFLVGALSGGARVFGPDQVGIALATAVAALAVIVFVGRLVLRPLFRWVAYVNSREVFIAAALLGVIGMSIAAQSAGLSMALGAFLAGMLLAETEFRHQIETDLEPFKDLLLGLFFVTVGMQIDLTILFANPAFIALAVLALFVVKIALFVPLARAFGVSWPRAIETAFLLGQVGEFAFIVVAAAQAGEVIPSDTAEFMLIVTALSIFVTPVVAFVGRVLARMFEPKNDLAPPQDAAHTRDHVVIAGCGRVGQMLGDILGKEGILHVGVDADSALISKLRTEGRPFHFGDASRREVLAGLGAAHASGIVITINRPEEVERIVAAAKAAWPHVPIYARARDAAQARRLRDLGADMASPDTVEAALQLGEALLEGCGVPHEAARRIIEERREAEMAKVAS